MRDIKLINGEDFLFDIDLINGQPLLVEIPSQSTDQRAAISAVIAQGSIPGMLDVGIQWDDYFSNKTTDGYVSIDNQMRQNIEAYGNSQVEEENKRTFTPVAQINKDGSIGVSILAQGGI